MIKKIDIFSIIRKIIISTILILLVLFPSKLQKSAKDIFGSVYAHYIKYSFVPESHQKTNPKQLNCHK